MIGYPIILVLQIVQLDNQLRNTGIWAFIATVSDWLQYRFASPGIMPVKVMQKGQ